MKLVLEAPFNSLSFGNVTLNLVREFYRREVELAIFPTGDIDLIAYDLSDDLKKYIEDGINKRWNIISSDIPSLKLWHINGSENRKTKNQYLFTFYECNEPTEIETSICSLQNKTFFSCLSAEKHFKEKGVSNTQTIPLGFDEDFKPTGKEYLKDVIHFGLMGKFEKRKHTQKIIQTWLKKYGNNPKYQLSCCVTNRHFQPEQMQSIWAQTLGGKNYNNLNVIPPLQKNSEVNEFLNAIDIDLTGLSGGEGWNLPAFNATCLGKWSIVLNCTSHKDWATKENSIMIDPSGEMPAEDGIFFSKDSPFSQGTFYTWTEEEAIKAMEKAESKVGQVNTEGQKLRDKFTYSKTVDAILDCIYSS